MSESLEQRAKECQDFISHEYPHSQSDDQSSEEGGSNSNHIRVTFGFHLIIQCPYLRYGTYSHGKSWGSQAGASISPLCRGRN